MQQALQAVEQTTYLPPPSPALYESCTPIMDGEWVHLRRTGFLGICKFVKRNADALRFFEIKTNQRIAFLRERYSIPEGYLPSEDYLWIDGDEAALREIPPMIGWTYEKSSLSHCLRERAEEGQRPSLIEQRFLRSRYIARLPPGGTLPQTTIFHEERWNAKRKAYIVPFIFVDDQYGNYEGFDGVVHNAMAEGHIVVRQFLYEIDNVNHALYAWKFLDPPPPKERWMPVQVRQKGEPPAAQSANMDAGDASVTTENKPWQTSANSAGQGIGVSATIDPGRSAQMARDADLFINQHNTAQVSLSTANLDQSPKFLGVRLLVDSEAIRVAPWSAPTIIDLVSLILAVPDPASCDEDEWRRDWLEPAQWIMELLKDIDPRYAWERIARHIIGMISGPTWYARERANQSSITLRHVVGWAKDTLLLNGKTWKIVEGELNKANWYPGDIPRYDGLPIALIEDDAPASYSAGYGGVETPAPTGQAEEVTQALPATLEVTAGEGLADVTPDRSDEQLTVDGVSTEMSEPAPEGEVLRVAMSTEEAEALASHIMAEHPGISLDYRVHGDDDVAVRLEYAPGRWCTILSIEDWNMPPYVALANMIRAAIASGELRASTIEADD